MSEQAQEHTSRANRRHTAEAAAPAPQANGEAPTTPETTTFEAGGFSLTVPVMFKSGHALTPNQAKVLQAAYERQYTNNQNAMAKARTDKLAAAKNEAEREAAQTAIDAVTAETLAAGFLSYEPNVGGTRIGSMEKIKQDAAWRFWTARVKSHNDAVASGGSPVIVKAGAKPVALPSGKGAAEKREALVTSLLALPAYSEGIQEYIDTIMAERGASKEKPATEAVVSGDDLL
jgi:hypothetical protein